MPSTDIAFAAGFSSVRQYHDTVRAVFATSPSDLRGASPRRPQPSVAGWLTLRLAVRTPFDPADALDFLERRAVPGVEEVRDGAYSRSMRLAGGHRLS